MISPMWQLLISWLLGFSAMTLEGQRDDAWYNFRRNSFPYFLHLSRFTQIILGSLNGNAIVYKKQLMYFVNAEMAFLSNANCFPLLEIGNVCAIGWQMVNFSSSNNIKSLAYLIDIPTMKENWIFAVNFSDLVCPWPIRSGLATGFFIRLTDESCLFERF